MSDLISRQAAIDALFELYEHQRAFDPTEVADLVRQGVYLAEKKIEKLPTVEQRWIPCSERLPEEGKEVLVTYSSEDGVLLAGVDHAIAKALWRGKKRGWLLHTFVNPEYTVHAWMPLPEPYQKGEQND